MLFFAHKQDFKHSKIGHTFSLFVVSFFIVVAVASSQEGRHSPEFVAQSESFPTNG